MTFEKKFRVETPYGVKIFQNFHFQKHAPIMEKRLAKKNFTFEILTNQQQQQQHHHKQQQQQQQQQRQRSGLQHNVDVLKDVCVPME